MMTLEDAFYDTREQNESHAKRETELSELNWRRQRIIFDADDEIKSYGRNLRKIISRRAHRIVRKHSSCWFVSVDVRPLHSHTDHTTKPLITLEWNGGKGDLKMTCVPIIPCQLEQFLYRFKNAVIAISGNENSDSPSSH